MTTQRFVGYWVGNAKSGLNLLNEIPPVVNNVNLFKGGITPTGSQLNTAYLCTNYPPDQLIAWSAQLQSQGTQVSMSLMDTPDVTWNQVDMDTYVGSVMEVAIAQWGLNGIDIDSESGMPADVYVETMVNLVTSLRQALGPDRLLTYVCYTYGMKILGGEDSDYDEQIVPAIIDSVDWINTMGYFWTTQQQQQVFEAYAALPGLSPEKINIGVSVGHSGQPTPTPLSECEALARWQPPSGVKGGMMLYPENNDNEQVTGSPDWTWTFGIANNLPPGS